MKRTNIYFSETEDVIDIRRDNVFKAVFARDTQISKGALSKLISALICKEVKVVTINANEPPIDIQLGSRSEELGIVPYLKKS